MDAKQDQTSPLSTNDEPHVPLFEIFKLSLIIGAFSFGGGLLAWVHREAVIRRKWLNQQDFIGGLTLAQVLPGINMTNISVYIGQRLRGAKGAIVATLGLLLVPFFVILLLLQFYHQIIVVPGVRSFLDGMAMVAVGLLMALVVKSMQATVKTFDSALFIIIIVVTVGFLRWPMLAVALATAPVSVAIAYYRGRFRNA